MMRSTPDIRNSYIQGVRKKNYTAQNPCSIQTTNDRAMSRACLFTGTSLWWTQRAHIMSLCMMSSTLAVRSYAVCHSFIIFKKKTFFYHRYVSVVYSEGSYGESGYDEFHSLATTRGICIALATKLPQIASPGAVGAALKAHAKKRKKASVCVLFTRMDDTKWVPYNYYNILANASII